MTKPTAILLTGSITPETNLSENFDSMFKRAASYNNGVHFLDMVNGAPPENIHDYSAFIITGSLAMVTDLLPWSEHLAAWLKKAINQGAYVLGICYGHQLMAQALGGKVGYHPDGLELGTHDIRLLDRALDHPVLKDLPQVFPANLAHSQTVLVPPEKTMVLAASNHDPHQIIAYGPRSLSFQFHPEFDQKVILDFIQKETSGQNKLGLQTKRQAEIKETLLARSLLQKFISFAEQKMTANFFLKNS